MRHRLGLKKLHRSTPHRQQLLRNMAASLFEHERIRTTDAKAKALRPYAERLITLAKKGDLNARRLASRKLNGARALTKLFDELGPRFKGRPGGYTRIVKLGARVGDGAALSLLELVDRVEGDKASEPADAE